MKYHKLFVYGTLRRGQRNNHLLGKSLHYGTCYIDGTMYSLGGFPFINTTKPGIVLGEVFEVNDETLARIDYLEGYSGVEDNNFYERIQVPCTLGVDVYVYVQNDREGNRPIPDGDWIRHEQEQRKIDCC